MHALTKEVEERGVPSSQTALGKIGAQAEDVSINSGTG